ncbi:MAG: phosphopantetheine-binding protein [Solirubrobacterales bacterium]|jgi:acyl carrier protein|nr:phosphopantetheine-binding protein [Solirubrobacterales bacterium]
MSTVTATDVEATVTEALESFGADADQITRDATLESLDIDSLDLAELSQIAEEKYGVALKGSDAERLKTVGNCIDLIVERAG